MIHTCTSVRCWVGYAAALCDQRSRIVAIELADDPAAARGLIEVRYPGLAKHGSDSAARAAAAHAAACIDDAELAPPELRPAATEFQLRVWSALGKIPAGTTVTYRQLADRIERPDALRAVAGACAANPIAVLIPCHRVVGSDGSLTGYRWGIERKRRLLAREFGASPGFGLFAPDQGSR